MGREWYFTWGSKSSKKRGSRKGGGGDDKQSGVAPVAAAVAASGGCMNAVLHMFDFNQFHLCLHPNNSSYLPDEPVSVKGVEAPRNSLESITEDQHNSFNIPMDIQVKTNRRDTGLKLVQAARGKVEDTLSQSSCSPSSARTPNLVARLMGLDVLPESNNTTPRSSSCHSPHITSSTPPPSRATRNRTKTCYKNEVQGPRSMPETPNSSSSTQRRRSTDVVDSHRLSLEMSNVKSIVKEMESSRPSCSAINIKKMEGRKYDDENKSPQYYAKQIMKQVRETVSRRVGADITNTVNAQREIRRDEHLLNSVQPTKPKKKKEASLSISPKLIKSSEISNKISENMPNVQKMVDKLQMKQFRSENEKQVKSGHDFSKKKDIDLKVGSIKPKSFDSIKNKKDEQFVRNPTRANNSSTYKKCKKTPLSSDLVHVSVPSIIPFNKDSSSSQPPSKLLEKQESSSKAQVINHVNSCTTMSITRLSRSLSQWTYEKVQEEATHKPADPTKKDTTNTSTNNSTSTSVAQFQYISRILKCTGIERDTPISFTRWYSPSHPLDPSIFHTLEDSHYLTTTKTVHSSSDINRKLIFHLVDEILAGILKPYIKLKPYYHYHKYHQQRQQHINGFQLVKTLCTKLRSFPSKDCQTLHDIDALVEIDMPRFGVESNPVAFEEEGEAIITKIEGDIIDSLIQEMALFLLRK